MFRFERLLVPVDFSPDSVAALRYALAMAQRLEGEQRVLALHVVDNVLPLPVESSQLASSSRKEHERELVRAAQQRLDQLVADLRAEAEILEAMVKVGEPASEIIAEVARQQGIDLIVVGGEGRGGALRRFVMGSTISQLQHRSPCPVLAVRGSQLEPAP
jgi:nucleotide-binding universal stress UspA family protein